MASEKVCPKCGRKYAATAIYCASDRAELKEVLVDKVAKKPGAAAAIEPADPLVGQVFDGRFELRKRIGAGGMGAVYEGWDIKLSRKVAIKVILEELLDASSSTPTERNDFRSRFEREARAAARLHHTNVVVIFEQGEATLPAEKPGSAKRVPYLVMEFLEGESLEKRIARGPLPAKQAVAIALQIAQALNHAHKHGIWHRDIKPGNAFLVAQNQQPDVVKVVDFGLARIDNERALTVRLGTCGTPEYIAPELWQTADKNPNPMKSDLYALGVTMYELLAQVNPFEEHIDNPSGHTRQGGQRWELLAVAHCFHVPKRLIEQPLNDPIPKALDDLVAALLAKDPLLRPDADATVTQLQKILLDFPATSMGSALLLQSQHLWEDEKKAAKPVTAAKPVAAARAPRPKKGGAAEPVATMPFAQARQLQVEAAGHKLDLLEPKLNQLSAEVNRLAEILIQKRWKTSAPKLVTQRSSWVTELLAECDRHSTALRAADTVWQEHIKQVSRERQALQDELGHIEDALFAEPPPSQLQAGTLQLRRTGLLRKLDELKTDPKLGERLYNAQRRLHTYVYALHEGVYNKGDIVMREWEKDPGLLTSLLERFSRAELDAILNQLGQGQAELKKLLDETRQIWDAFPDLRSDETVRLTVPGPSKK